LAGFQRSSSKGILAKVGVYFVGWLCCKSAEKQTRRASFAPTIMDTRSHARNSSPSALPASSIKYHYPYFTPSEVESMSEKQRGKMSIHQEDKIRSSATGFLEILGSRMGFPRRTIATSQSLYHRFHLFFPRKDFNHIVSVLSSYRTRARHAVRLGRLSRCFICFN